MPFGQLVLFLDLLTAKQERGKINVSSLLVLFFNFLYKFLYFNGF